MKKEIIKIKNIYNLWVYASFDGDFYKKRPLRTVKFNKIISFTIGSFIKMVDEDTEKAAAKVFWNRLNDAIMYFEPKIFNEKIALESGFTPFTYHSRGKEINLLALSRYGNHDASPKFEVYQSLAEKTIYLKE